MKNTAARRTAAVAAPETEPLTPPPAPAAEAQPRAPLALMAITLAGMIVIPLFTFAGVEAFRLPKELVLRTEGILLAAFAASWWLLGRFSIERQQFRKPWMLWLLSVLCWSALTTLTATNRLVSFHTLGYITAMSALFVATVLVAKGRGPWLAALPLLPAAINVAVLLMQQAGRTIIQVTVRDPRLQQTALIGNPNDVGSYMMVASLAATALAISSRRWRWYVAPVALFLMGGTLASATLTAIGALLVGLTVLVAVRSWKFVAVAVVLLTLFVIAAVRTVPPLQHRYARAKEAFAKADYDTLLSYRFTGFATALMMAREHPIVGVGPGGYAWNYFDFRYKAEQRYQSLRKSGARPYIFGEAHNDHLQVLAQTGVFGYLLFAAGLLLCASLSFRRGPPATDGERFSRLIALPLAAAFAVLALAQFPLELTSVLHLVASYAAMALAWGGRA